MEEWERRIPEYETFAGRLHEPETLLACLEFESELGALGERVAGYTVLKKSEDAGANHCQEMYARALRLYGLAQLASSFIAPELLAIPAAEWDRLVAEERLAPYRLLLDRIVRLRPHTLSRGEEEVLALFSEASTVAEQAYHQYTTAEMKIKPVRDAWWRRTEMGYNKFIEMQHSRCRRVRKASFDAYYKAFEESRNTLSALLAGSIQWDISLAKSRRFSSSLDAALFEENIPGTVYENLVETVHRHLPSLHRYYDLRRRKMRLREIRAYDTYVPVPAGVRMRYDWDTAVETICDALVPLGPEYVGTLRGGLRERRWCDKYENEGKSAGAFSAGTYKAPPYILMNFNPEIIESVFTLAHEAGHSMHSWYSAKHQPFRYYQYGIFVAEVASTFNEQLLGEHLIRRVRSKRERAWLINHQVDAIRNTIFRQTMFAEFEKTTHESIEQGRPLSAEGFRRIYRSLLDRYFGPRFAIDEALELECFRIPHFYHSFYVYKYATGMSAAIALADRVLRGGERERNDYLTFLGGGCSREPLDLLRLAGVDMESPAPIEAAMRRFSQLVDELESLI